MMKTLLGVLKRHLRFIRTKEERRHALVGPADLWQMKRDFQIQFLKAKDLKPEHYLLDIGCGTLRGGIPLIAYLQEGHYFGVEVRAQALEEGRKELQEAGLEGKRPTLLLSQDMSQLVIEQKFDYIWAFSVLIHMSDEILNDTLAFVNRQLSDEGVFYANVNIGDHTEGRWRRAGLPTVTRTLEFYSNTCAKNGLAASDLGPLKEQGHDHDTKRSQSMLRITRVGS